MPNRAVLTDKEWPFWSPKRLFRKDISGFKRAGKGDSLQWALGNHLHWYMTIIHLTCVTEPLSASVQASFDTSTLKARKSMPDAEIQNKIPHLTQHLKSNSNNKIPFMTVPSSELGSQPFHMERRTHCPQTTHFFSTSLFSEGIAKLSSFYRDPLSLKMSIMSNVSKTNKKQNTCCCDSGLSPTLS